MEYQQANYNNIINSSTLLKGYNSKRSHGDLFANKEQLILQFTV